MKNRKKLSREIIDLSLEEPEIYLMIDSLERENKKRMQNL
jgi:hypothetical protein